MKIFREVKNNREIKMESPSRIEYSSREIHLEDSPLKQNELEAMESFVPDVLVTEEENYLNNSFSHNFRCKEENESFSCPRSGSAFGSEEEMISSPSFLISDEGLTFKTSLKRKLEGSDECDYVENNLGYLLDQAETDGLTPFQDTNYPYFGLRTPVDDYDVRKSFNLGSINSPNCFPESVSFHSLIEKDIKYSGSLNDLECHIQYINESSEIWRQKERFYDQEKSIPLQNSAPDTQVSTSEFQFNVRTSPSKCTKEDASAKDISTTFSHCQEKSPTSNNNGTHANQTPINSNLFNQKCPNVSTTSLLNNSVSENTKENSSIKDSLEITIISESSRKSKSISSLEISNSTSALLVGKNENELQQPELHEDLQIPISGPGNTSQCNIPAKKKLNSGKSVDYAEATESRNLSPKNSSTETYKPVNKRMSPTATLLKNVQKRVPSQGADQTVSNSLDKRPSKSSRSKSLPKTKLNKSCKPPATRGAKFSEVCEKTPVPSNILPQTSCNAVLPQHPNRQELITNIARSQVCTTYQNPSPIIRPEIAGSLNGTTCALGNFSPRHANSLYPSHSPLYGQRPNFHSSNGVPSSSNSNPVAYSKNFAPGSSSSPFNNFSPSFNTARHLNSTRGSLPTYSQQHQTLPYCSNGERFHYFPQGNHALSPNSINFTPSLPNTNIRPQIPNEPQTKSPTVTSDLPHHNGNSDPFQRHIEKVKYFSRYPWIVSDKLCLRCYFCENAIISSLDLPVDEISSAVTKHNNSRIHILLFIVRNKEKFAGLCKILIYQIFSMENKNDLLQSLGQLYGYERMSDYAFEYLIEAFHGVINDFHNELLTKYKFTLCIDICRGFAYFRTLYGGEFQEHFLPYDMNNGKLMQAIEKVKGNLISRYEYLSCGKCAVCFEIRCKVQCVPVKLPLLDDLLWTLKVTTVFNTYANVVDALSLLYQSYAYFFHSLPNAKNCLGGLRWYKIGTFLYIQTHKGAIKKICRSIFDKFGDIQALGISSDYPEFARPLEHLIYFLDFFVMSIERVTERLHDNTPLIKELKRNFNMLNQNLSEAQFAGKETILAMIGSFIDEIGKEFYYSDKLNRFLVSFLFDCSKLAHIMNDESSQYILLLLYNQVKTALSVSFQVLLQSLITFSGDMMKKNIRITNFFSIFQLLHDQETSLKYPGVKDFYAAIGCLPFYEAKKVVSFSLTANLKYLLTLKYGEVLAKDLVGLMIEVPRTKVGVEESRNKMLKQLLEALHQSQRQNS